MEVFAIELYLSYLKIIGMGALLLVDLIACFVGLPFAVHTLVSNLPSKYNNDRHFIDGAADIISVASGLLVGGYIFIISAAWIFTFMGGL